uniref:Uncharacterized protein n=1 Tax=Meloidogyne floridensis TaxID=298350 RepID=A0A915P0L1_9BILA
MLFSFQISSKIIFVNSQQNISSTNNFISSTTKNLILNEIFNNNFKLQKEQNKWKRFRRRNEKIRGRKRRFFGVINSDDDEDYQQQQQDPNLSTKSEKRREETETELENELMAEFVRVSLKHENDFNVRYRKKTFTMTQPFECYSCMSSSYQAKWGFLKEMYFAPKMFADACDAPIPRKGLIPTVLCASFCVSMLEPSVFVGFKYIRGCGDLILRHGFNKTAIQIHRFAQVDKCRQLPRAHLFNQPRQLEVAVTGNLQLCTCYGERCNGGSSSKINVYIIWKAVILMI